MPLVNPESSSIWRSPLRFIAAAGIILGACSIDSYSNDMSNLKCGGERYGSRLSRHGDAIFTIRDKQINPATIVIKRAVDTADIVSKEYPLNATEVGPFQPTREHVAIRSGPETTVRFDKSIWTVDIRKSDVVISGDCK